MGAAGMPHVALLRRCCTRQGPAQCLADARGPAGPLGFVAPAGIGAEQIRQVLNAGGTDGGYQLQRRQQLQLVHPRPHVLIQHGQGDGGHACVKETLGSTGKKNLMPSSLARRERDPEFLRIMAVLAAHSLKSRKLPEEARRRANEAIARFYQTELSGAATAC